MAKFRFRFKTLSLLAAVALTGWSARADCRPDGDTLLCGAAPNVVRILKGTASPDGTLAVGWGVSGDDDQPGDIANFEPGDDATNATDFLIRLSDGKVLKTLKGATFDTKDAVPSHIRETILWSPNGRLMLELDQGRYATASMSIYVLSTDGNVTSTIDLLTPITNEIKKRFRHKHPTDDMVGDYDTAVWLTQDRAIDDQGNLVVLADLTYGKRELDKPTYRIALRRSADGLSWRLGRIAERVAPH